MVKLIPKFLIYWYYVGDLTEPVKKISLEVLEECVEDHFRLLLGNPV